MSARLLTHRKAAEYSGFSVRYLRTCVFERRIAFVKRGGRIYFERDDLDAYIDEGRIEAIDDTELVSGPYKATKAPPARERPRHHHQRLRC